MEIQKVKRGYASNIVKGLRAIGDTVLVTGMHFDSRVTNSGIIIPGDDAKSSGIRPRWGRVYSVGPDHTMVKPGQWVLVAHGRWTRGIEVTTSDGQNLTIRRVDNNDILGISDVPVHDETIGTKVA